MKIIRFVIAIALGFSILFGGIYLKFFPTSNNLIDSYIVQVGIYKQEENANNMMAKLTELQQPNYKYQNNNNFIVFTGVFLNEQEAKEMGNIISEKGITCVIKQVEFDSDLKDSIANQNYEMIINELGS